MAERQIIVVSEVAPRLSVFATEAARTFLRDYVSYENRLGVNEVKIQMKKCMEPDDLDTLLECSEPLEGFTVVRELPAAGPARDRVRVDIQSPIAPVSLARSMDEERDDEEEEERESVVLYLSNAHIEAMLVQTLGPHSEEESSSILRAIKMPKEEAYSSLVLATTYVRKWKDGLRWCKRYLPRNKTLVKFFTGNVFPKRLAYALDNEGIKSIKNA